MQDLKSPKLIFGNPAPEDILAVIDDLDTPAFVYDSERIQDLMKYAVDVRAKAQCGVLFAVKSFSIADGLEKMAPRLDGFAVSSLFEARLVAETTRSPLHLTTPGLRHNDLHDVASVCDYISFNSLGQLGSYRDAVARDELKGAVLLVARRGVIVMQEAVGWRHEAYQLPMERDTIFRMASNTKPVIATAALILQEEGKLSLDDRVATHLDSFDNVRARDITIQQLLSHASGFRIGPIFTPPTVAEPNGPFGTLMTPATTGGTNWPGGSLDPINSTPGFTSTVPRRPLRSTGPSGSGPPPLPTPAPRPTSVLDSLTFFIHPRSPTRANP